MPTDTRFAVRVLAKNGSSTAIAVGILAIAIGANTAIFSVMNAALLKLLPVRNPDQLLMLTDPNASMVLGGMLSGERSLLGYEEFTRRAGLDGHKRSITASIVPATAVRPKARSWMRPSAFLLRIWSGSPGSNSLP